MNIRGSAPLSVELALEQEYQRATGGRDGQQSGEGIGQKYGKQRRQDHGWKYQVSEYSEDEMDDTVDGQEDHYHADQIEGQQAIWAEMLGRHLRENLHQADHPPDEAKDTLKNIFH